MNKFKFGDKVIHREYRIGVVVEEVASYRNIPVIFDKDLITRWIPWYELNPISHPDTIQLNALKDKISKLSDFSFTCNLCGEDNEISAEIQDIIDFAITEEQADD